MGFFHVGAADRENGGSVTNGFGEAVNGLSQNKFLQVVLVSPQVNLWILVFMLVFYNIV